MTNILITGGAGNIGSSLASNLVENNNYYVVVADNLITGSLENLPVGYDNFLYVNCNVNSFTELSELFQLMKFDYIFHYAALVGVKRTLENPMAVLEDIEGIKNILFLAKKAMVKRVFYSSSSEVYGESMVLPQNEETTPLNSRLPYAIVKNVGEAFFKSYQREYGLDYGIFRFFNTYGPKQSADFVIAKFIDLAIENKDITIYGVGNQTRTFCYIDDNIETTKRIFEENLYKNDVVNVGSSLEVTIKDLATIIIELTNSSSSIIHVPALEEGDMTRRQPDNSKMQLVLNRPLISLKQGISNVLEIKYNIESIGFK